MYSANGKSFGFPVSIQIPGLGQDVIDNEAATDPTAAAQPSYTQPTATPEEIQPVASAAEAQKLIAALQQRLTDKGFSPGAIDGIFGSKTNAALDGARVNAGLPTGTDRVTIMQRSSLNLPYRDAARIRDAINYQTAAIAARKKAAAERKDDNALLPTLPFLPTTAVGLTKKWWFWGLLAVGLTGAGIATYYIVKKSREGDQQEGFVPDEPESVPSDDDSDAKKF